MKKISLLFILFICLFVINVKADMGPPMISTHKVMVTNKEGTYCYSEGKKTDKLIPYGTMLDVMYDIQGNYIYVQNDEYSCDVKYSDVSAKTQSFDLNSKEVEKIKLNKAVILASGGLNLRKGPAVTYSKIITIPQYTVVTLTRSAGTYWYYTDYKGNYGWITGMNGYFGIESNNVLYNYEDTLIYSANNKSVLGKIPANTPITDYLELLGPTSSYYVNYNGTKGYISLQLFNKIDEPGKIKLIKDYTIYDESGKPIKKLTANQELEYTMVRENTFYIPEKKMEISLASDEFEYVKKANISLKKSGFIGEGLFGEEKGNYENEGVDPTPIESNIEEPKKDDSKTSKETIIIICLLAGIFLSLTALVIVKVVNSKKTKNVNYREYNKKDIEARIDHETAVEKNEEEEIKKEE